MTDPELLSGFLAETHDMLDEVEPILVAFAGPAAAGEAVDEEALNAVFRLFHSIKGSAGFLGLQTVVAVTHQAETLLDLFRSRQAQMSAAHVERLCTTIDFVRMLLPHIEETQQDSGFEMMAEALRDDLAAMIDQARQGSNSSTPKPPPPAAKPKAKGRSRRRTKAGNPAADTSPALTSITPRVAAPATPSSDDEITITPAMKESFAREAEEQLDAAEQAMLKVEQTTGKEQARRITEALRALHSLKGNAGFMGLAAIEHLTHRFETALEDMREGLLPVDIDSTQLLLIVLDVLRDAIKALQAGSDQGLENGEIYEGMIAALPRHTPAATAEATPQAPPAAGPVTPPEPPQAPAAPVPADAKTRPASGGTVAVGDRTGVKTIARQDIRVDVTKLDTLINLVGELVIAEAMVTRHPHVAETEIESLDKAVHLLRRISRDLQDVAMSVRMVPLAATFRKMLRLVHDLANRSGKQIHLQLSGEETEVDKTVIEKIADPLVHIVRNAADHGLETAEQRQAAGKDATGTIHIEARHEGGEVWVIIRDDGRGLDRSRILAKAQEKGLVGEEAQDWPDERIFRLIFEPGFSTAATITDVSGRGVGMDVVKRNLEALKGRVDVSSRPGQGSTFTLRIPLTLAIIEGMLVRVGAARYTIPMLAIRESFRPVPEQITTPPDGRELVRVRDDFHPVLRLHRRFQVAADSDQLDQGVLVLVEAEEHTLALLVDEILGQQETVIKGLSNLLANTGGVSGCTILGDGAVSLILDVGALVEEYHGGGG